MLYIILKLQTRTWSGKWLNVNYLASRKSYGGTPLERWRLHYLFKIKSTHLYFLNKHLRSHLQSRSRSPPTMTYWVIHASSQKLDSGLRLPSIRRHSMLQYASLPQTFSHLLESDGYQIGHYNIIEGCPGSQETAMIPDSKKWGHIEYILITEYILRFHSAICSNES